MRWNENDTFKFVELYRDHECLWNKNKIIYKNRYLRQKALDDIMHAMNLEGFGPHEIKKKIKNIRSTYNQELQKIKKSTESGECLYKPVLKWFHIMDVVMKNAKETSETQSNLDSQVDIEFKIEQIEEEKEIVDKHEITIDEEQLYEETTENQLDQPTQTISSNKGTKRRHDEEKESSSMNQAITKSESSIQENEAFGRYVTSVLNILPQRQAILAQNEIQSVLTRFRLNMTSLPSSSYILPTSSNDCLPSYSSSTSVESPSTSNIENFPDG